MVACHLEIKYLDRGFFMDIILWPTCERCASKILVSYLNQIGYEHKMEEKNGLKKVYIGLIAVSNPFKQFESLAPRMSYKNRIWEVSLFLDINIISSNPPFEELDKYIKKCICERMDELKTQKTLRGIKDRTMLDDIKQLFV